MDGGNLMMDEDGKLLSRAKWLEVNQNGKQHSATDQSQEINASIISFFGNRGISKVISEQSKRLRKLKHPHLSPHYHAFSGRQGSWIQFFFLPTKHFKQTEFL